MKPFLPKNYPHGLVCYDEYDILLREGTVKLITAKLKQVMYSINPAIKFIQVETPTLIPAEYLHSHIETGFELIEAGNLYLRPETTRGTFEALKLIYQQTNQLKKALPVCIWQFGKSYRNEQTRPFKELRFKEFYQLEYQLIYTKDTKADYHEKISICLRSYFQKVFGEAVDFDIPDKLPHYSNKTTDLYVGDIEIVGISTRRDFDFSVLEIACGLDRICALLPSRKGE